MKTVSQFLAFSNAFLIVFCGLLGSATMVFATAPCAIKTNKSSVILNLNILAIITLFQSFRRIVFFVLLQS